MRAFLPNLKLEISTAVRAVSIQDGAEHGQLDSSARPQG
ncbi:hypothetical protein L914_21757 [Phytophthora nicotianae]|uniref:Uncharacterized protein n=1 Tax=Phytophthora nicotianae TaxID=4792 RepID=W2M2E8_PHYNI|nr:hypothetical protein L914_21757 [Phytophthora nicotianae]